MSVECSPLFVIDMMPRGMVRARWGDIFLMAHVSTEDKTCNKTAVYMSICNGYLVTL